MVAALIQQTDSAGSMIKSASALAKSLKKEFAIVAFVDKEEQQETIYAQISNYVNDKDVGHANIFVLTEKFSNLSEICEKEEFSFLFLQLTNTRSASIQQKLNACRSLRIPYLLYKDSFPLLNPEKVMVPVTFLEEEYEKAQFVAAFGRFYHSEIHLLLANDYGSKARTTAEKMIQLFDKFQLKYSLTKAGQDSFKIEKEAVQKAESNHFGIIILSASRDYGLDDILFGPKERHLVKKSSVPILLINPRGDLYALCD